jgi:putative ABC transport system permease protein
MKGENGYSPRFGGWLLRLITRYEDNDSLLGDFDEEFVSIASEKGRHQALIWYWRHLMRSCPSFLRDLVYWGCEMLKNYMKIAWRNIKRHKGYSFINLTGLAIGMACCIFILMWVKDEMNVDTYHQHSDNLYHVRAWSQAGNTRRDIAASPPALGPALKAEYPEVVNVARFNNGQSEMVLQSGSKQFTERIQMADPEIFDLFTFPFVLGDSRNTFTDPHVIVLSESVAERMFPAENPIDKIITVDNRYDFKVVGVMAEIPHNSTIRFDVWLPLSFTEEIWRPNYTKTWSNASFQTYVLLDANSSYLSLSQKMAGRIRQSDRNTTLEPFLFSFPDSYLEYYGARNWIRVFTVIAVFVLLIACINFINLSTARSAQRAKEVGLRKVVGAFRKQLVRQFFGETLFLTGMSLFLALGLVLVSLPLIRNLTGKPLDLDFLLNIDILIGIVGIALVAGILSGIYPALILSAVQPAQILKGWLRSGTKGSLLRKVLVVTQFVFSVVLIFCTAVIHSQVQFMRNQNLGFDKDQLIYIQMKGSLSENYEAAGSELLKEPGVEHVTFVSRPPTYIGTNGRGWDWEGRETNVNPLVTYMAVYPNFLETFDVVLAQGKFFEEGQKDQKFTIINEHFAGLLGMENPVGKSITNGGLRLEIKGVVKDFHFMPLHDPIGPIMVYYGRMGSFLDYGYMFIKIRPDNMPQTLASIEKTVKWMNPEFPFVYRFLDEDFEWMYRSEVRIGALVRTFSVLAIFISCLGLFGLASFMAERRVKEIGIRKVLGATVSRIMVLLTRDIFKLVLIANLIAWPFSYYVMHKYLQEFAYRVRISPWIFVLTAVMTVSIALGTVGYQSLKAALAHPVRSLRYE